MREHHRKSGWTLLETLIVIGILGCLLLMLLPPAILASRETARRGICAKNLSQIGIGISNYQKAYGVLPASASLIRDASGKITGIGGPSLMAAIFPYMKGTEKQEAAPNARFPWMLCPSYGGSPWADPATQKEAITNYRPFGATHIESLSVASPNPMTPKYVGTDRRPHPDGICFPASYRTVASILKGISYTLFAVESLEPRFARWTVGAESAIVGLPRNVEFEKNESWSYVPKGYSEALKGNEDSVYWTYHTYLDWNYDRSPYDGADGARGGKYGPSSNHPDGANHLMCDDSVHFMNRSINVSLYTWLIFIRNRHFH